MVYRDIYDFKEIYETTADKVGTSMFSFLVHNLDTQALKQGLDTFSFVCTVGLIYTNI